MTELADEITEVVRSLADKPVHLFGHSLGATIGFEVARRLEALGARPASLFVSARRAPDLHRISHTHLCSDMELVKQVRSLASTDPGVFDDPELVAMVLPVIRSDYKAAETYTYTPGQKLTCPVVAFVGDTDPMVKISHAAAWENHTTGAFRLRVWAGGHFYLEPRLLEMTAEISAAITTSPRLAHPAAAGQRRDPS